MYWCDKNISLLKKIWHNYSLEEITRLLPNYTLSAIQHKASRLKLKRTLSLPRKRNDPFERFIKKIKINPITTCWEWTAFKNKNGYGTFRVNKYFVSLSHRWIYEYLWQKIPNNLTIDHICNNTSCVNIFHLKISTLKDNVLRGNGPPAINARKTHCKNGHKLSGYNLIKSKYRNERLCRICQTKN